jgi:nucleotide-binding universal stress UspA family protein
MKRRVAERAFDMDKDPAGISTILCAVDFSESSERALAQALRFVRLHKARLILAHIVEPIPLGPYPVLSAPSSDLEIRAIAEERLQERAETIRSEGHDVLVRVELGPPGPTLVTLAAEEGVDLCVMGTRGLTGFSHLLLGSVAEYVVRRCESPVLTIHPQDEILTGELKCVLLPTDLSLAASPAAETLIDLLGDVERPHLILAYADRMPAYLEPFRHDVLMENSKVDVVKEDLEASMEPIAERLRAAGFSVEKVIVDGEAVSGMLALAKDRDVDLIMMTTHGRSAVSNLILGRTTQRVVQHAERPVLTVHPPK